MRRLLGLDVGGANIKAAHAIAVPGEPVASLRAWSETFALWRAPAELEPRLRAMIAADVTRDFDEVRLTMTAELCDCFATKREGVNSVLDAVVGLAGGRPVRVWSTQGCFVEPAEARAKPLSVAASNWHALGTMLARRGDPAEPTLLIDIGSTTTDIMRIESVGTGPHRLVSQGLNDMARLSTGELVYTGAWRTPLMVYGPSVIVRGRETRIMSEYFSSMADVHLLLGNIAEEPGNTDTADGRPATCACAAARIVRMVGADLEMLTHDDVLALALQFATRQKYAIAQAIAQVVGREVVRSWQASGEGSFIAKQIASEQGGVTVTELADAIGGEASIAACAWAMVSL